MEKEGKNRKPPVKLQVRRVVVVLRIEEKDSADLFCPTNKAFVVSIKGVGPSS